MPKFPTYPDSFDGAKQITITSLMKIGYLAPNTVVSGTYSWTRGGKPFGWINITASVPDRYIELSYNYGDKPINYRVQIESIPKHFGGCEWYFLCPATGKRCRTLYDLGERFLSRFAYPYAMYDKQMESKQCREMLKAFKCLDLQREFLTKRHSRTSYNGKLTKRYSRILDKERRFDPTVVRRFLNR